MSKTYNLHKLGDNIEGGVVAGLLLKEGETCIAGQPLLEIETDKAVAEIVAETGGTVKKWLVKVGDTIKIGAPYMEMEEGTSAEKSSIAAPVATKPSLPEAPATAPTQTGAKPSAGAQEIVVPNLGDNIKNATVLKVLVQAGQRVQKGEPVLELETDKATFELPSPASGKIEKLHTKVDAKINTGEPLFLLLSSNIQPGPKPIDVPKVATAVHYAPPPAPTPNLAAVVPVKAEKVTVNSSPRVRRFAREIGIDIDQVPGTGEHGRVTEEDVKNHSKNLNTSRAGSPLLNMAEALPDFSVFGAVERLPLGGIKKATMVQMAKAWSHVPMVTEMERVDVTELEALRQKHKGQVEKAGGKLTMTAILIKALAQLLKEFPNFNSSLDQKSEELVLKKYIHIGVAVDTEKGLIVPVIRNADSLSITAIALELGNMSNKARARKIAPNDLQGASFTISNLGGIGTEFFTPIVNWPEVAILGVSKSSTQPVYDGKAFQPRLIMPLSLTFDHRVIDGAEGARFLVRLREVLENPFLFSL